MYTENILFIHGYQSSGKGFKAEYLRKIFPNIHTPTLTGELKERMEQILPLFLKYDSWGIIGSSYGGVMATLLARQHPSRISRLILMAPALIPPLFSFDPSFPPIEIPTDIFHGLHDTVISLEIIKKISAEIFTNLEFHVVKDEHKLRSTTKEIPWRELLSSNIK